MDPEADARHLDRIRRLRVKPDRDLSLRETIERSAAVLRRNERGAGRVADAWERSCPAEYIDRTSVERFAQGVLTIVVADAATRYALDRFLRSGGERTVIKASPAPIRKVRLRIGRVEST